MNKKNVLFAGEGGQGVQVAAEILARAAFKEKKFSSYIPNFGVEQRGGVSLAFVVIDNQPIIYPKFQTADILVILSDRSVARVKRYQSPKTKVIKGPAMRGGLKTELPPSVWNIFTLGKANQTGSLVGFEPLKTTMLKRFEKRFVKRPELKALDIKALAGN